VPPFNPRSITQKGAKAGWPLQKKMKPLPAADGLQKQGGIFPIVGLDDKRSEAIEANPKDTTIVIEQGLVYSAHYQDAHWEYSHVFLTAGTCSAVHQGVRNRRYNRRL
jgi:hypothetical protein